MNIYFVDKSTACHSWCQPKGPQRTNIQFVFVSFLSAMCICMILFVLVCTPTSITMIYSRIYFIRLKKKKKSTSTIHNTIIQSHYNDVIMGAMASQITSLTIVYSTVHSGADQRKHQSSASLTFVWGIHRWPVNSPHKCPVTRKMFPFDDVIICCMFDVVAPNWEKDILGTKFSLSGWQS